ncbi:MAG: SH3 domain-containing protein [Christensenellaceae bacterium]|jgi:SpoIID/LytB domain protein|nr:SH3 domain-containing protein [Christensenellaceae bacterium]
MRKISAAVLSLCVLLAAIAFMPVERAQAAVSGMVRVKLDSMGSPTSVTITLNGAYSIPSSSVSLSSRSSYDVYLNGGSLWITGPGASSPQNMGNKFTIQQNQDSSGGTGTMSFYNARYGSRSYRGDMQFEVSGSSIRMINRVFIEDYLYGVLHGELSNSFPLETLKAQAIIARSYVYNKMLSGAASYDIGDTSNDQVYKGYTSSDDVIMRAVNETAGMLLKYGSSYISAYFGASNGGQVELPGNAWSASAGYPGCYVMKDDPYDLRNPSSRSSTYSFGPDPFTLTQGFRTAIENALYYQMGSGASLQRILDVRLVNPLENAPASYGKSRNYRAMEITVEYYQNGTQTTTVTLNNIHDTLRYTLFGADSDLRLFELTQNSGYWSLTLRRYGHGVGMSQRGAQQMALEGWNAQQIINFYFEGSQIETLSFSKDGVPAGPSQNQPAAAWGTVNASSLNVRASASNNGSKLGSLTRNSRVGIVRKEGDWYLINYGSGTGYVSAGYIVLDPGSNLDGATPTPTPGAQTPTLTATVRLSTNSSTLNMRSAPSSSASVVTWLNNGTQLGVLEQRSDGWLRVRTSGGLEGYVSAAYVTLSSIGTPTYTPGPTPTTQLGTVTASQLNVRAGASSSSAKVGTLNYGAKVKILGESLGWYRVEFGGLEAYAASAYILKDAPSGEPAPGATPTPSPTPGSSTGLGNLTPGDIPANGVLGTVETGAGVYLEVYGGTNQSTTGSWLMNGAQVLITGVEGDYYRIAMSGDRVGYVLKRYIRTAKDGTAPTPSPTPVGQTPTPSPTPTNPGDLPPGYGLGVLSASNIPAGGVLGTVRLSGTTTSLTIYADANKTSPINTLANGIAVTVMGVNNDVYNVNVGAINGFVLKAFIMTPLPSGTAPTPTPSPAPGDGTITGYIQLSTAGGTLRLRQEPSTASSVLTQLPNGAMVAVINQTGDWYRIGYGAYTGYVMKSYVRLATNSTVPDGGSGGTGSGGTGSGAVGETLYLGYIALSDANSSVNVRSSASSSSSVLGSLKHGTAVEVLASNGDWYRLNYGSGSGYVLRSYIRLTGETKPGSGSGSGAGSGSGSSSNVGRSGTVKLSSASSTVNVRSGPGTSYAVTFVAAHGQQLTITAEQSGWYGVTINGKSGYISAQYVALGASPAQSSAQTTAAVHLRSSASATSNSLGTYTAGTTVTVLEKGADWSKVSVGGKTGYMKNSYLRFS